MVHFYSNYLYHLLLFGFFTSPNIRYTFIKHLVRYILSLIYKGIRLYARVTNLGPEGKQTLYLAPSLSPFEAFQRALFRAMLQREREVVDGTFSASLAAS